MPLSCSARIASTITALTGICASILVAAPAQAAATTDSARAAVSAAERTLALRDDSIDDAVSVHSGGDLIDVPLAEGSLPVTAGGAGSGGAAGAAYTIDRLNGSATRLAAVLPSASEASWDFEAGTVLIPLPDGRVSVSDDDGNLIAGIDAPWAVDTAGESLPTRYSVEGTVLIQHIDFTASTKFPVVADPKFTSFPGYWTATFNRSESASVVRC
jgi:hypothetical protein